ncbi:hypothetical protein HUA74_34560 [Myxococcus sp. CA051A]|uniref:Uncharacterized protein n=1 Tax=Myxococcus llanfairpwllgwyngyllgogerychwyrndrobwllllantysiliogogogochensis TaxID=2590453 RepID=A0A540WT54_9BACT|nr:MULTISPECIES: hypothetical protein [Myxococcus]NTX03474.1 hypothetical protein [Myxococcus sp. CA040A]NTX11880.1 hypothetical protein [Myxococcus sp. CA056]NTX34018.1 hypothetical protein [Myxococcus sp. CA033]NTX54076.1 hypothetical protein [Myxococcus sp. CA039A]NTX65795.1 hypothetical protein [Myxococcus sp. CA051A]
MGRIVTFVLGIGVLAAAAWYVLNRPARTDPEAAAARKLENVHKAADRIETDLNKNADAIFDKVE